MRVFCTHISGSGAKEYLAEVKALATSKGRQLEIISLGPRIVKEAARHEREGFNPYNILNIPDKTRARDRSTVFERLLPKLSKLENVIIESHAQFLWNKEFTLAFDGSHLRRLNPDMLVTIVDDPKDIAARLRVDPQWRDQELSFNDIERWQQVEVNDTARMAEMCGELGSEREEEELHYILPKPHYILPRKCSPTTLYKLLFHPEFELAYFSYPIGYIEENFAQRINRFAEKLQEYFALIVPWRLDLSDKELSQEDQLRAAAKRDLCWFVEKCKMVILNFPKPVTSFGVASEIVRGCEGTKDVLGIFPKRFKHSFELRFITKRFYSEQAFFDYLHETGYKPKQI